MERFISAWTNCVNRTRSSIVNFILKRKVLKKIHICNCKEANLAEIVHETVSLSIEMGVERTHTRLCVNFTCLNFSAENKHY